MSHTVTTNKKKAFLYLIIVLIVSCDSSTSSFEESIPLYTISTNVTPAEGGTIQPSEGEFPSGEQIQIEARPADGYVFEHWEGDLTGNTNPSSLLIDSDKNLTAKFLTRDYDLDIEISGEGIVREAVAERSSEDDESDSPAITSVTLSAEPEEGWFFDRWEGDLRGSDNPETITVDEEKNVTAVFDREVTDGYTITIDIEGEGSVEKNPNRNYFIEGDEVTLTAIPESEWNFIEWRGDLTGTENSQTIEVEGDIVATAVFGPFDEPFLEILQQPSTTPAGSPVTPAPQVKLLDESGNPVEDADVNVSLNENSFTSGSSSTITTNSDGIATFDNLAIETAQSGYILTFETDEQDVSEISSTPFEVLSANADPSSSSADVPEQGFANEQVNIAVTLEDEFGNPVNGAADELSVDVSGANSVAPSVSDEGGGQYSAVYSPSSAGTDQVEITVNGDAISGSPYSVEIIAASPSEMEITQQPTATTAGSAISPAPAVRITDEFGNTLEGENVEVELEGGSFASGSSTTAETNSNGTAEFDNLIIHSAGSEYSLQFQVNGTSRTSDDFDVAAANADPSSSSADVPEDGFANEQVTFTISLEDEFGNPVSGAADELSVEVSGANSASPSVSDEGGGQYSAGYTPSSAGTDQVEITVNGDAISGSPYSVEISAASPSEMEITQQPTATTAGSAISPAPAVRITDDFGNALEGENVEVELEGGSFASGSSTSAQTNSNGVAEFENLVVHESGSGYSLQFQVNGTSRTSNDFDVTAAGTDPSSSGAELSSTEVSIGESVDITIALEDEFGNSVSGAADEISVEVSGANNASPSVSDNGGGQYSASYSPSNAGSDQVAITVNGQAISGSPYSVEVSSASPSEMEITQQPTSTTAGSAISPAPAVRITDEFGNALEGENVEVELDGGSFASGSSTSAQTNSNGTAEFDNLVIHSAGSDYSLQFQVNGLSQTSNDFDVTAAGADPSSSGAELSSTEVSIGESVDITIALEDEFGNSVSGAADEISVDVSGANNASPSVSDDGGGQYSAGYTPSNEGTDQVAVTVNGQAISGSPYSVEVSSASPSEMEITQQPTSTTAGSAISPAPAVRITDEFGNALEGENVEVELDGGSFASGSSTSAQTNSSGTAEFDNLVIHSAGSGYSLQFQVNGLNQTTDNFEVTAADADPSSSSADVPDGEAGVETTITIMLQDRFGNTVSGAENNLSVEISGSNSATPSVSESGTSGEYITQYTPENAGTDQIDIYFNGTPIDGSPYSSSVSSADVSPSNSTVTANPDELNAGESSTITVEVRDENGNPVSGLSSGDFDINLSGEASIGPITETSTSGTYEFEVTRDSEGEITISVSVNGITLDDTPEVDFEERDDDGDDDEAGEASILIQPENTRSGEPIGGPPTVQVKNKSGQEMQNVEVSVREQSGQEFASGDLVANTNQSGIAEFTDLVIEARNKWFHLVFSVEGVDDLISERFRIIQTGPPDG